MHFKTKTKGQYILARCKKTINGLKKVEEIPNKFGQSNVIMILQEWFGLKIQKWDISLDICLLANLIVNLLLYESRAEKYKIIIHAWASRTSELCPKF